MNGSMSMSTEDQLARTILLLQTDLGISDARLVFQGLQSTVVTLVADAATVRSFAGQVAISTSAMLAARSGHQVFIDTPNAPLLGEQAPLSGKTFHEALDSIGTQTVDAARIAIGCPLLPADIAFVFGDGNAGIGTRADLIYSVGCSDWAGSLRKWGLQAAWSAPVWPMGAMAAATLVGAECFKVTGRALLPHATKNRAHFQELFEPIVREADFRLAPADTPLISDLGDFDLISAGAVSNAFLYAMLRLPGVPGRCRVFEGDVSEHSNRNRNMLLVPAYVDRPKGDLLHDTVRSIDCQPMRRHFTKADLPSLASRVVVGVDDISVRWDLAESRCQWMGVGATTHFGAMASVHYPYAACAACLHPRNDAQDGDTPTVAFVSFMAGLMVAADYIRESSGGEARLASHHRFAVPLQMGGAWEGKVTPIPHCPAGCPASKIKAA